MKLTRFFAIAGAIASALSIGLASVQAHDGVVHYTPEEAAAHLRATRPPVDDGAVLPFPVKLGGAFTLTDQHGDKRSEVDPDGAYQLVFFGYAKCQAICTVALPRMAEITELSAKAGVDVQPILITVDPARDTPDAMKPVLKELHPDMIGLTGSEQELADVRKLFQIERTKVMDDPVDGPIYAHGTFIYLLDSDGEMVTLFPPILSPERGAEIVAKYWTAAN